ncbi:MAG: nucleotidyltransferase domain-containing protein [Nanoarchaeota archaeon]
MKTIFKPAYWNILEVFYMNKNTPVHLRELSRRVGLQEGPLTRHLNKLVEEKILTSEFEGNLKKFSLKRSVIPRIFTVFDIQRFEDLPYIRKNSVKFYTSALKEKPVLLIVFGSTAKGTHKKDSDIDIIAVFNRNIDTSEARRKAEAQTGVRISEFQMSYDEFKLELKLKNDQVIQSGVETGILLFNHLFYYEELYDG